MNPAKFRLAGALWLSGTLLIHALVLWNFRGFLWKGYADFTIYYAAGTMVRRGMGHELYDNAKQFAVQREFASGVTTRFAALPFNHPPFEAVWFAPLSYFSYHAAYLLWAAANLVMLAVLPVLLRPAVPLVPIVPGPAWMLASLAFFPIFLALMQGQDTILLLFLYALVFLSLRRGRVGSAGAWLACGLFKFHLVLPFVALWLVGERDLLRRKKFAYGFGAVALVLALVSIRSVGVRELAIYPRYVLGLEANGGGGSIYPPVMPNLRGLLSVAIPHASHLDWLVIFVSGIVFLIAAWIARSSQPDSGGVRFSLFLLGTVLVSYHALGHDLSILMLPVIFLAEALRTYSIWTWEHCAVLVGWIALVLSPLHLVLLMRYNRYGWMGLAVLLCFAGIWRQAHRTASQFQTVGNR